ncbi:MAG: myo-inositol-1(or 4)-monophosphatase [Candidatus Poriferisodalaceae bacterium]|jgi:fructose-1,6-bisphosphatase/inositol monophosphatase family enzyme
MIDPTANDHAQVAAELRNVIADVLELGGRTVMRHRGDATQIAMKTSQADLVTSADLDSEREMIEFLQTKFPADAIISEEHGAMEGSSGRTWVIDPLDGTVNFAAGSPSFGVIVGLCDGDDAIAGGMFLPASGDLFLGIKGHGATHNGVPLTPVSAHVSLADALFDHSTLHYRDPARAAAQLGTLTSLMANARGIRCDHSLRYLADVALGRLNGFVYHSLGLWDITGPSVILGELGYQVTNLTGEPLDLSPSSWVNGRLYAAVGAEPQLLAEVIELLNAHERS